MNNCTVCGEPCASGHRFAKYCSAHAPRKPAYSMRAAINAKCRDCIVDSLAPGNWLDQVGGCSCQECPLFGLRPGQNRAAVPDSACAVGQESG